MTAMIGECPECGAVVDLNKYGSTALHYDRSSKPYIAKGDYCSGSHRKPVAKCKVCFRVIRTQQDGSLPQHFNQTDGIICKGSGVNPRPPDDSAEVSRMLDEAFRVRHEAKLKPRIIKAIGQSKPEKRVFRAADLPVSNPAEPVKPVPELCKGGIRAVDGCVACGNKLYADITGCYDWQLPTTYEGWRDEYIKRGIPWAHEQMLALMTDKHQGVLDEKWTPDDPSSAQKKPANVLFGMPVGATKAVRVMLPAAVAIFVALYILTGKTFYDVLSVAFVFATLIFTRWPSK